MAAVLTPKLLSFPHNILHDSIGSPSYLRMERNTPPRPSLPSISSLIEDVDKHAENRKLNDLRVLHWQQIDITCSPNEVSKS